MIKAILLALFLPVSAALAVTPITGGGVKSVSVAAANGVSGTSSGGTTPALTLSLGAITPSTVTIGAGSAITSSGAGGALGSNAFTSTAYAASGANSDITALSGLTGSVASTASTALSLTAGTPAAASASTVGNAATLSASNATAGTSSAGAAAGGAITVTAGNAARFTSGNANGGDITLTPGSGIGTGTTGSILLSGNVGIGTPQIVPLTIKEDSNGWGLYIVNSGSTFQFGVQNSTMSSATAGTTTASMSNSAFYLSSGGKFQWDSTTSITGVPDLGFARNAAGVVEINNGTAGTFRDLKLRNQIQTGTTTTYNNIATVSNGIPAEYATVDLTGQTAAKTITTLYTPAATGMYRVSVYLQITMASSTSSVLGGSTGVVLTYTDGDGSVAQSDTVALMTTAGAIGISSATNTTATNLAGSTIIYAKTGVAIQYAIDYTSVGTTPMAYAAHLKIEAL